MRTKEEIIQLISDYEKDLGSYNRWENTNYYWQLHNYLMLRWFLAEPNLYRPLRFEEYPKGKGPYKFPNGNPWDVEYNEE